MFKRGFWLLGFIVVIMACSSEELAPSNNNPSKSLHPLSTFFYPIQDQPKVYVYRDTVQGLQEEFHRIYTVEDLVGLHLVVEIYTREGVLSEAINYNVDSLDVQDHMVVNRYGRKEKAMVYKKFLFPANTQDETWFASKFSGTKDSTVMLYEVFRKYLKPGSFRLDQQEKAVKSIIFNDKIRITELNPFEHTEQEKWVERNAVFAENVGLVAYYNPQKSTYFKLEKIMDQKEWLKIIQR